jgi:hypothetical protein
MVYAIGAAGALTRCLLAPENPLKWRVDRECVGARIADRLSCCRNHHLVVVASDEARRMTAIRTAFNGQADGNRASFCKRC